MSLYPATERIRDSHQSKDEELIQCPYDKSHFIQPGRMQTHLVKCSKRPNKGHVCPFNYTHHLETEVEFEKHVDKCPDRHKMNRCMYQEVAPIGQGATAATLTSEENWDSCDHSTYDPINANKNVPLIMAPKGLSRARRRKYREEQRLNYSRITSGILPDEEDENETINSGNQY